MPKKLVAKVYVTTVKQSFKIVARKTTQSRTHSGIKFEIYSIIFLHFKEEWISTISTGLQKVELAHNEGQGTITIDWESN